MQKTKDSFLNHLASRLAELDATLTVTIGGVVRPAVMACENERAELSETFENTYYLDWKDAVQARESRGYRTMTCTIRYWTSGAAEMSGVDRGRKLTSMDEMLKAMLSERKTAKVDWTKTPAENVGIDIFWGEPKFGSAEQAGMKLRREVKVDVHDIPEEGR